jgi:plasmid stabilization system protein ParE
MKCFVLTKPVERDLYQIKSYLAENAGSVYSYLIVYDPKTKPIQILRVLHGMRNVEEILN